MPEAESPSLRAGPIAQGPDTPVDSARREFLIGTTVLTSGLALFASPFAAYVELRPDGELRIVCPQAEIGQGVYDSLPRRVADEMDADWARVVVQPHADAAFVSPVNRRQRIGGSDSVVAYRDALRVVAPRRARCWLPRPRRAGACRPRNEGPLTAALDGETTIEGGAAVQRNFDTQPLLRLHELPRIDVHQLPSEARIGGVGESGVPPVAPALANAIFAAAVVYLAGITPQATRGPEFPAGWEL